MSSRVFHLPKISDYYWDILVIASSGGILLLTLYCLMEGITTVFMHLYYFPIILLAYHYHKKGLGYSVLLGLAYLAMVVYFDYARSIEILGAVLRVLSFIGVAAVVAYLSINLEKRQYEYRTLNEFHQGIVSNANVWLSVLDEKGNILVWNRAAEDISGYTSGEVIGRNSIWKQLYPENDYRKKITQTISKITSEKRFFENFVTSITTKNHTTKMISWNTRAVHGEEGTLNHFIAIGIDITERKMAEDALALASKKLSLLSSITRHDILNQLMALKGYLDLSHDSMDDPDTIIEFIKKEELAANAIENQIKFTRDYEELGVAAPLWQNVNASILRATTHLPMRDVKVQVNCPDLEVYADPLFERVFYNLLDNALRYGGDGMKTIRVCAEQSENSLTLICEDDGVGISNDDKKRLFFRGFGKNTGLGLFLSREILAITGITIAETGNSGKGARFELMVPKGMFRFGGTGQK